MNLRRQSPSSYSSRSKDESLSQIQTSAGIIGELEETLRLINVIRATLKQYRAKKENSKQLWEKEAGWMSKHLSESSSKLKRVIQSYEKVIQGIQKQKSQQIFSLKSRNASYHDELYFKQSEHNKKIMELQGQFNKKQQEYENIIQKFVGSIIQAQKTWNQFGDKCSSLVAVLEEKNQIEEEVKAFYETIISMVHSVSTKHSLNDSNIDHMCEMSSIMRQEGEDDLLEEQSNFDDDEEPISDVDVEIRKIEQSLKHLVTRGFFNKENEKILLQFYEINQRFSWKALTNQDFYTTMLQFIREGLIQQQSMQQNEDKTVIEYHNQEECSSLIEFNQKRCLENFQQKGEDSIIDIPSEITKEESY